MIFAILMAIGYAAAKAEVLTKEALASLSRLIVKVILPAMIFSIVALSGVTTADFLISGRFILGAMLGFALLIITGLALSKLLKLEGKQANIFIALMTFGNVGFMGIPLIQGVFDDPVVPVSITVFAFIDITLLWTFGVYLCSRHRDDVDKLSALKNIINPMTISLILGMVFVFFNIPVPSPLQDAVAGIGNATPYLALMYIGGMLAYLSVNNIMKKPSIFVLVVFKLLVVPVTAFYFLGFFMEDIPRSILAIIIGLPSMTTIAMLATVYQSDDQYATEIIFVTTLACLLTIPFVSLITSMM
ncbi:AEC family transporter [Desulfuribacillus alkaliarsenatis]|uniref:AEC family transporter n=1 Tax=Desulfuribacillus alkaliarsenatis TaxID=766136 RepID=UPI00345BD66D